MMCSSSPSLSPAALTMSAPSVVPSVVVNGCSGLSYLPGSMMYLLLCRRSALRQASYADDLVRAREARKPIACSQGRIEKNAPHPLPWDASIAGEAPLPRPERHLDQVYEQRRTGVGSDATHRVVVG